MQPLKHEAPTVCADQLADPGLPTLAEVLDPAALAGHLRGVAPGLAGGRAIDAIECRVLRHIAGRRCTLEVGLHTDRGRHVVIGKVYRRHGAEIFDAMQDIRQAGFGPREAWSIPEPLAYLPSLSLLLQERVEGQVAEEVFRAGDAASRAAAAERSARWLARFHAQAPRTGPVSPPSDYFGTKRMRRCAPQIHEGDGGFAHKVDRLQARLERAVSALAPSDLCAGHGAYRPDHIFLDHDRTVVFDFDARDVTDPARDVARFLVAMRRLALDLGSSRALDEPYEVFLKTYLAVGQPAVERNLRAFEGAACLKRAKRLLAGQAPRWRENTEAMLDEGLRVLEQEVA